MQSFKNVFQNLAGEWKLVRQISSGERFAGTAVFEPLSNHEFLLKERGELHMMEGNTIEASREWHWALQANDYLIISYNENPLRLYHRLEIAMENGHWRGSADHFCAPDTYSGAYKFEKNKILIDQKITGPKKDYSVSSLFER